MSMSGHVLMNADIICNECDSIVRPVQKDATKSLRCPCCQECVDEEVNRFNSRYGWD